MGENEVCVESSPDVLMREMEMEMMVFGGRKRRVEMRIEIEMGRKWEMEMPRLWYGFGIDRETTGCGYSW
jgi:hypothetical protein